MITRFFFLLSLVQSALISKKTSYENIQIFNKRAGAFFKKIGKTDLIRSDVWLWFRHRDAVTGPVLHVPMIYNFMKG